MYSFRCKNCNKLIPASHAGVNTLPKSCILCGSGVTFDNKGNKTSQSENWEVLSDLPEDKLKDLGLTLKDVHKHQPSLDFSKFENLKRSQEAYDELCKKEKVWFSTSIQEWKSKVLKLDIQLLKLEKQEVDISDINKIIEVEADKKKIKQEIQAIINSEWTSRDIEHKEVLKKVIDREGNSVNRLPKSVFVYAKDSLEPSDSTSSNLQ